MFYIIEYRTKKGGVVRMKKSNAVSKQKIDAKKKLGKKIARLRKSQKEEISSRTLAIKVGLSPSNMKYIEDGVNAPTAEIYAKIVGYLEPKDDLRDEMDSLYTIIRGTPPPDVCDIIIKNKGMNDVLRSLKNKSLSAQQLGMIKELFDSFETETIEGEY